MLLLELLIVRFPVPEIKLVVTMDPLALVPSVLVSVRLSAKIMFPVVIAMRPPAAEDVRLIDAPLPPLLKVIEFTGAIVQVFPEVPFSVTEPMVTPLTTSWERVLLLGPALLAIETPDAFGTLAGLHVALALQLYVPAAVGTNVDWAFAEESARAVVRRPNRAFEGKLIFINV